MNRPQIPSFIHNWRKGQNAFDWAALALAGCFFALWAGILSYKYFSLGYYDWDLALYSQALWNLCHGRFYSSLFDMNFLGNHAEYISFLLVPIYTIFQHPLTLIYLKVLSFSIGGYILYHLARQICSPVLSLIVMILYLTFPANSYTLFYEFHIESLNVAFLFLLFYFFKREKLLPFYGTALLTALIKENMPPIIAAFGIYALFTRRNKIRWGLIPIITSVGLFYFSMFIITPKLRSLEGLHSPNQYLTFYATLGEGPFEIMKAFVFHPQRIFHLLFDEERLNYLKEFLQPLAFTPLLSPQILFLALPVLLQQLLSSAFQSHTIFYHYAATLVPFFFLAALQTLHRLKKDSRIFLLAFIAVVLCALSNIVMYKDSLLKRYAYIQNPLRSIEWKMIKQIPVQAGTIASLNFLSPLSHKQSLHSFLGFINGYHAISGKPFKLSDDISYALIDFSDNWITNKIIYDQDQQAIARMQAFLNLGWRIRAIAGTTVLLERSPSPDFNLVERSQTPMELPPAGLPPIVINKNLEFLACRIGKPISPYGDTLVPLTFYWKSDSSSLPTYGLQIVLKKNGQEVLAASKLIGYSFSPTIMWHAGEYIKETYYLCPGELAEGPYEVELMFVQYIHQASYFVNCPLMESALDCKEGRIKLGSVVLSR